jgi:hypothetical protein
MFYALEVNDHPRATCHASPPDLRLPVGLLSTQG